MSAHVGSPLGSHRQRVSAPGVPPRDPVGGRSARTLSAVSSSTIVRLAERAQVGGEVAGGGQGVGVVVAEDAAAPVQGVLVQVAGGLVVAERAQVGGEVA